MRSLRERLLFVIVALSCAGVEFGCLENSPAPESAAPVVPLQILSISGPSPLLEGTPLSVQAAGVKGAGGAMRLQGFRVDGTPLFVLEEQPSTDGSLSFTMSPLGVDSLGVGSHDVRAVLSEGADTSEPFQWLVEVATALDVSLGEVSGGDHFRNDLLSLTGSGFLASGEGTVTGHVSGTFTDATGVKSQISVELPVALGADLDRSTGLLRLTTAVGGVGPGSFLGGLRLRSTLASGGQSQSTERSLQLEFHLPEVTGVEPLSVSLGQILKVHGGGFLGAPGDADEVTLLRFDGTVEASGGGSAPFGPAEIVAEYVLGTLSTVGIATEVKSGELVSSLFGIRRGSFAGSVTPITIKGSEEVSGPSSAVSLEIRGAKQVVEVRLLPGYHESLARFGLGLAADAVASAILARLSGIYSGYAVSFDLGPPEDFLANSYATLEIGGPDPNGYGLFGYDNTPGKDVGNLRLYDSIGGENADTQADGYPGYGGVFIESYLWWSSHPGLSGARPAGAPPPDPLFDEIFDSVRSQPATQQEILGVGDGQRLYQVQRAIYALGAIIGETAAHELGHSLGLAQPEGPATAYHSLFPGDGCLMDSGADRPLGERAAQPGYSPTSFCGTEAAYLMDILAP